MKRFLFVLLVLSCSAVASAQIPWLRGYGLKLGEALPDTNGVYFRVWDGNLYVMDFAGSLYKRTSIGNLTSDSTITATKLVKAPYFQVGTGLPAVSSFPYGFFTNVDALFYTTNLYVKDGLTIADYSGNGSRLKFLNATGTQILNNKGISFQIAQNAAASAMMVDSTQIAMVAPKATFTNGSTTVQILLSDGGYGWMGTATNQPLYLGANNSGKLTIAVDGSYTANAFVRGTASFTTTGVRAAVYIAGAQGTDFYVATPIAASGTTLPVAGDLLAVYAKTDSLIVCRAAGTTSGLSFNWIRLK